MAIEYDGEYIIPKIVLEDLSDRAKMLLRKYVRIVHYRTKSGGTDESFTPKLVVGEQSFYLVMFEYPTLKEAYRHCNHFAYAMDKLYDEAAEVN